MANSKAGEKAGERDWLRNPCAHAFYLGPLTDLLMRRRPAVCIRCWIIKDLTEWAGLPEWTEEMYQQYQSEVERRFFNV